MAANLETQLFKANLEKQLYPDNAFYKNSMNDTEGSQNDRALQINIPIATTIGSATVNPTLPLTTSQITDTATYYETKLISTPSIAISTDEESLVKYDKTGEIRMQMADTLNTQIADQLAYHWALEGSTTNPQTIVKTTGDARPVESSVTGATGNRLALTLKDIIEADKVLNSQNLGTSGDRIAVISPEMKADLLKIESVLNMNFNREQGILNTGAFMELFGFKFYVRTNVNRFDSSDDLKAIGSAGAADDNFGALFYQSNYVRRYEGGLRMFANPDSTYQGSVLSANVRMGGIAPRNIGVVSVVADS